MKDHRRFKDQPEQPRYSNNKGAKQHQRRPHFNDDEETIDLRMLRNRDVDDLLELIESTQSK